MVRTEFIIPPNPYLGDDKRNPPLGLLYVTAVAERSGLDVRITDLRGMPIEALGDHIGSSDIYGITAATPDYPLAQEIARICHKKNQAAWTVLGGIHATAIPDKISDDFDKVVVGEGENSFLDIVEDFRKGRTDKRFYQSSFIQNLDEIPFPAYNLVPFESAFSRNAFKVGGEPAATIITSRGCPHDCSFCVSGAMWERKVRFRSPANVIEEMKMVIEKYGIKQFRVQDDTMTLKPKRLEELCSGIKELGVKWRAATRVDRSSYEYFDMMKKSGCEEISLGIETLCQEALDKSCKRIKVEACAPAVKAAKAAGLKVRLYFIIGLPGEQPGFADRLIRFTEENNPDGVDVSTLVPYPGSDIYRHPEKYGFELKGEDFARYNMTLGLREGERDRDFTFVHDVMSEEQLKSERQRALEFVKKRNMVMNF